MTASSERLEKSGTTRPSVVYALTPEIEQLLSKAYVPVLTQLVDVFAEALPAREVEALLRRTGKELANELSRKTRISGSLEARVAAASELMNEQLGALTHVERNGEIVIRGAGCPLAALTGKHRGVCLALESLVTALIGVRVHESAIATSGRGAVSRSSVITGGSRLLDTQASACVSRW